MLSNMVPPFVPGVQQAVTKLTAASKSSFAISQLRGGTGMFATIAMAVLNRMMLNEVAKLVEDLMTVRAFPCLFIWFVEVIHVLSPI
jgi:hypothetical protein